MSLTNKTYKHLASLAPQQEALNEFIVSQFDDRELVPRHSDYDSLGVTG
jgi:MarR family transcriptional regulator, organic hydroperoxide resistance regulator